MNLEELRAFCKTLPGVTEDIKWEQDMCFCIGGKMFCITWIGGLRSMSFKVTDEEFAELSESPNFIPAPYLARYKWVKLQDVNKVSKKQLQSYIKQSYELVKAKLSKKILKELDIA